jgi:pSer/pThr/pTyr-binding forkhead associated (FHA) protein
MSGLTRVPGEAGPTDANAEAAPQPDEYLGRLADRLDAPEASGAAASRSGPAAAPQLAPAALPTPGTSRLQVLRAAPGKPRGAAPSTPPPTVTKLPTLRGPAETSDVRPTPPEDGDEAMDVPPVPSNPPAPFSEFEEEDELESEATAVEDRDELVGQSTQILREEPALPILFVEAGRDQGREYVLQEGETSVGRGVDNDVILADISVSRRHLKILREGESLTLRDLGSGNGTFVNGRRVHVATLSDGDRIEVGETVLVVRLPRSELAPAPAVMQPTEVTTDEMLSSASLRSPSPGHESPWALPPPAAMPPTPVGRSSAWWLALGERTGTVVLDRRALLVGATTIAVMASMLGALVVAIFLRSSTSGAVASAIPTEPAAVPIAMPPPVPAPAPIPRETSPGAEGRASSAGSTAAAPIVPGTRETPAGETPPIEDGREAGRGTAPGGGTAVTRAPEPAPEPTSAGGVRGRGVRGHRGGSAPVRVTASRAPASVASASDGAVLAAYRRGDFAEASRLARAAGRASLAAQIEQFAAAYRAAQSAARGSRDAAAVFERAIALDRAIDPSGNYGARLRDALATRYLDAAQSAMSRNPQEACGDVRRALAHQPASSRAQRLSRECEAHAQRMVQQASAAERTDPARAISLYRAVLHMVPPGSPTYQRARERAGALGRRHSVDEDE